MVAGPTNPLQAGFESGVLAPELWSQNESQLYGRGCQTLINGVPNPKGPCEMLSGSKQADQAAATAVRCIPFIFNSNNGNQSYIIEITAGALAVYQGGELSGHHTKLAITLTGTVPYDASDLPYIDYVQSSDVIYLTGGAPGQVKHPQVLTRTGALTWTIADFDAIIKEPWSTTRDRMKYRYHDMEKTNGGVDGYYAFNGKNGTGSYGNPVTRDEMDQMFAVTYEADNGIHDDFIESGDYAAAWGASSPYWNGKPSYITKNNRYGWWVTGKIYIPETGRYVFAINSKDSADIIIPSQDWSYGWYDYHLQNSHLAHDEFVRNSAINLSEGNVAIEFRYVYHQDPNVGIAIAWRRDISTDSDGMLRSVASSTYDMDTWSRSWEGNAAFHIRITALTTSTYKWEWRQKDNDDWGSGATWGSFTEGGTGINFHNGSSTLQETGISGYGTINFADVSFTNTTGFTAGDQWDFNTGTELIPLSVMQQSEANTATAAELYPSHCELHDGRLWYARNELHPRRYWASKSQEFDNFTTGTRDADSIEGDLDFARAERIVGLAAEDDLFMMTDGPIVRMTHEGPTVTPSDIGREKEEEVGAAEVKPISIGSRILFVDRSELGIFFLNYSFEKDRFTGQEITKFVPHLFNESVIELAFQRMAKITKNNIHANIIWAITTSGNLYGMTLDEDLKVAGWFQVVTGGTVKSMGVIPHTNGDEFWIAVTRGSNTYIEYFTPDVWSQGYHSTTNFSYTGSAINITLLPFISQYVKIYNSSGTLLDTAQTDGVGAVQISATEDPGTPIYVGNAHQWQVQTLPFEYGGNGQNTFGRYKRQVWGGAMVRETNGGTINDQSVDDVSSTTQQLVTAFLLGWDETQQLEWKSRGEGGSLNAFVSKMQVNR